jgi:hypothetical protein
MANQNRKTLIAATVIWLDHGAASLLARCLQRLLAVCSRLASTPAGCRSPLQPRRLPKPTLRGSLLGKGRPFHSSWQPLHNREGGGSAGYNRHARHRRRLLRGSSAASSFVIGKLLCSFDLAPTCRWRVTG